MKVLIRDLINNIIFNESNYLDEYFNNLGITNRLNYCLMNEDIPIINVIASLNDDNDIDKFLDNIDEEYCEMFGLTNNSFTTNRKLYLINYIKHDKEIPLKVSGDALDVYKTVTNNHLKYKIYSVEVGAL